MHPSVRWLTAGLLVSLSFACSARGGGGGGLTDPDAATGVDTTASPMDSATPSPDSGKTLPDVGFTNDLTTPPTDNGVPPVDLGVPARCGDGLCTVGETCTSCATDCGACPARCGDGACQSSENCTSCPGDCGACPASCGDGTCAGSETCATCTPDCGACPPRCGDGTCNGTDTCSNCPGDCGACPPSCASLTTCSACAANPACGWCTFPGACEAGNSSGPTSGSSFCPTFGTWIRSASSCSAPDAGVRDAGTADAGTVNIMRSCTGLSPTGTLEADCGWQSPQTYSCTPGGSITVGCTGTTAADAATCGTRLGSCSGDPMIRACSGSSCTYARRLVPAVGSTDTPDDDECGTCPLGRYTCPSTGQITVYTRPYNNGTLYTCTLGRI